MTEPMTLERFRALADAFGGIISRWPHEYQGPASRLAGHAEATAILADALALDQVMDKWRVPALSRELAARVAASAPVMTQSFVRQVRLWWSGIGIAAALAGSMAGIATVAMVAPAEMATGGSTSFGDIAAPDS